MGTSRGDRLTGTVTFLFSDIEASTQLVQRLDPETYRRLLEQHHRLVRAAMSAHDGWERGTQGDSFLVVFRDAPSALSAAVAAQRALASAKWPGDVQVRVRMGIHTGIGIPGGDDYVGVDINRAARIASAAHGGQILVSDATRALADRSLPAQTTLRDLGEHRLKGIDAPERIFQLSIEGLPVEFPPPRAVRPPDLSLPPRSTTFVGREEDLARLTGLVRENRLLTLVGPGGTGKTSLATELARRVALEFADGAWFVSLAAVAEPEHVGSAIVAGLDLRGPSETSVRDRLVGNLAGRSILLLLDNFEHVLDAAPLVADLLAAAPGLTVLATSRAPLLIGGEQLYPVPPLALPANEADLESVAAAEAVQLFVDRASRVRPDFSLTADNAVAVADICRRLDGLPLGIELATSRIAHLGVAGIRDRLARHLPMPGSPRRDVPARQRTLDDAIAWSHDLLDQPARTLFARLSVFAGGWRADELAAVCGDAEELGADPEEVQAGLVEQSLVGAAERAEQVRFAMLDSIREFAAKRLAEGDDRAAIHRRHGRAYLALAEAAAPQLETSHRPAALDLLASEADNLLAALRWSIDSGDAEVGLRLCAALGQFWVATGFIRDAEPLLSEVLALPAAREPSRARMRGLEAAALMPYYRGDNAAAGELYRQQLVMARQIGDRQGEADGRFNLTWIDDLDGHTAAARRNLDEIIDLYRELGDDRSRARAEWARGKLLQVEGRHDDAIDVCEGLVARFRELDDVRYEVMAAGSIAAWEMERGNGPAAARWLMASMLRERDLGDVAGITLSLPAIAVGALMMLGPEPAATAMGAFEALSRRYGLSMPVGMQQSLAAFGVDPLEGARAAMDEESFARAVARGAAMSGDEVVAYLVQTIADAGWSAR